MKNLQQISSLKNQSTWRLFFLALITLGVYLGHYIKKQTQVINSLAKDEDKLSEGYANFILVFAYISLFVALPYILLEEHNSDLALISNALDRIWAVFLLVWGFMARNAVNKTFNLSKQDPEWFHGFWTFLFTPLYFNYKVNSICDDNETQNTDTAETEQADPLDFKA